MAAKQTIVTIAQPVQGEAALAIIALVTEQFRTQVSAFSITTENAIVYELRDNEKIRLTTKNATYVIVMKANAEVFIEERDAATVLLLLEEGAIAQYAGIASNNARRFAWCGRDAQLDWRDASFGSSAVENTAYLAGSGANVKFRSVLLGTGDERYDVAVNMLHLAPNTTSNMLTRAALTQSSRGAYRGLINIAKNANGCAAHQREDTLLLGDESRMDAVPVLEIENHDVKCSHGVALGQVDDEKLFYLASRGIPRDEAVMLLVSGFFDQLLSSMGDHGKEMREEMTRRLLQHKQEVLS